MRPSHVRLFDHGPVQVPRVTGKPDDLRRNFGPDRRGSPVTRGSKPRPPAAYAAAFAQVQEGWHAGNSYEVNLTYRVERNSDLAPAAAYLRLRELNPAPYAGFLQHDVTGTRPGC